MKISGIATMIFAAAVLAACQTAPKQSSGSLALTDEAAIRQSVQSWQDIANSDDLEGFRNIHTDDVMLLDQEAPLVEGIDAFIAYYESFPPFGNMDIGTDEVEIDGDLAFARGVYAFDIYDGDVVVAHPIGKWIGIFTQTASGDWLLHRLSPTTDQP